MSATQTITKGDRVESVVSGDYGTVTHISVDGRIRVEWDDRTNSSHAPRDLRVI